MRICPECGHRYQRPQWRCPACGHEVSMVEGFPALAPDLAHAGHGFRREYFGALASLESGNFWFRARNRLIIDSLRRHFPGLSSFLEIGCGTGFVMSGVADAFPSAALTGTEIFVSGLGYAAGRIPRAELLQVDARRLPFDAEFDVVGIFDVLEHIQEDTVVLSEIYRALRPGGGVIITVPQHDWLWSQQDELAFHVRRYGARELHKKVSNAGFRVIEMRSFVSLLLPVLWLQRRFGITRGRVADPMRELRMSPLVNRLLGAVMATEFALGRMGVSFPGGGSLLLVGRKE